MTEWTFALVDLAGYTALTETHGDEHAAELATTFAALATECLASGDRLVKPIGDAVLPASTNPSAGISLVDRLLPPALTTSLSSFAVTLTASSPRASSAHYSCGDPAPGVIGSDVCHR